METSLPVFITRYICFLLYLLPKRVCPQQARLQAMETQIQEARQQEKIFSDRLQISESQLAERDSSLTSSTSQIRELEKNLLKTRQALQDNSTCKADAEQSLTLVTEHVSPYAWFKRYKKLLKVLVLRSNLIWVQSWLALCFFEALNEALNQSQGNDIWSSTYFVLSPESICKLPWLEHYYSRSHLYSAVDVSIYQKPS